MGQEVSIGVMCLHIQVRKLPLLGIAVAGVFCCMGLRSMPIEPRCYVQNLRSSVSTDRDHLSLDWLSWFQYVSINGLTRKKYHCSDRKNRSCPQFLSFRYCLLVISQPDMNSWNFDRFLAILKGIGSKPDGSTPQIANSNYLCMVSYTLGHFCFVHMSQKQVVFKMCIPYPQCNEESDS